MQELSYNSKEDTVQESAHNDELLLNYIFPLLHICDFQLIREHFVTNFCRVICPFLQVP